LTPRDTIALELGGQRPTLLKQIESVPASGLSGLA
jgi:hypothetical protein